MNKFDDLMISLRLAAPADSSDDDGDELDVFESPRSRLLGVFDANRAACQIQQSPLRFLIQMVSGHAPEGMRDPVRRESRFERERLHPESRHLAPYHASVLRWIGL